MEKDLFIRTVWVEKTKNQNLKFIINFIKKMVVIKQNKNILTTKSYFRFKYTIIPLKVIIKKIMWV